MRKKLLLADDSVTMQRLFGLAFSDEPIDVYSVADGAGAVQAIQEMKPDIILADVFLPGKTGYELCEMVKSNPSAAHIPVLLLVGTFEPLDSVEAQRVKADGSLTKPFETSTMIRLVQDLLDRGSATGESAASIDGWVDTEAKSGILMVAAASEQVPAAITQEKAPEEAAPLLEFERKMAPEEPAPGSVLGANEITFPAPEIAGDLETTSTAGKISERAAGFGTLKTFAVSAEIKAGQSLGRGDESLLELDLASLALDEQTRRRFMGSPILDIDTEPPVADEQASVSAPTTREPTDSSSVPLQSQRTGVPEASILSEREISPIGPPAPPPQTVMPSAPVAGQVIPEEWIEAVAERVIRKLSDAVVREIAWEVVPELSEMIIREQVKKQENKP